MKTRCLFFISLIFLTGCSYFFQGHLEVLVTADEQPVQDAQLILYGKNKNKDIFIGYFYPNPQGLVTANIDFSKYQSLKIVTTSKSIDKILLPAIEYVSIPHWWQEQVLKLVIKLPDLPTPSKILQKPQNTQTTAQQESSPTPSDVITVAQMETDIYEPPAAKEQVKGDIYPKISPQTTISQNNPHKVTITENSPDYLKSAFYKVVANNKPIANAQFYLGYNSTQTIKKVGESDADGEINFKFNTTTPPDIFIIKKVGFITQNIPFVTNVGNQALTYELKPGVSYDFLVQNYAYDFGRGFNMTSIVLNGAKQDVSSGIGFMTLAKELKSDDVLTIEQKNSIITNITSDDIQKQLKQKAFEISTWYLPSTIPFKPVVGLIEPNLSGAIEDNMLWRRARREFFSRFINEQSFKTKIQDDLIKMTNSAAMKDNLVELFKRGWQNASFAKDVDLIMQIDFVQNEESPAIVGKIYSKNGRILLEQKKSFTEKNAEQISSQLYNTLLEQLPIEAYVVQQEKGFFTFNVGKKQHISKGDLFVAYIPQNFYSIPDKPVGVLKIVEVFENEAKASVVSGLERLQSNLSIRGIRAPQNFIDEEIKKEVSTTSSRAF